MVNMWPATHYVPTGDPYFQDQEQYEVTLWRGGVLAGVPGLGGSPETQDLEIS